MKRIRKLLSILGPGFITGASDDDPSGIATYSQTGAIFGFAQLWTVPFMLPLMVAVQEMCGRIGLVTGHGLAGVIKRNYSKSLLYSVVFLLFLANGINIGADLGAMASSVQLLVKIPFIILLLCIVVLTLALEIFVSYKTYAKYLKYLTFSLLAYFVTVFFVKVDWGAVFVSTIIPHFEFSRGYLLNIVALFGTTISPYLFFWQATEEVEEEIAHHRLRALGIGIPRIFPKDLSRLRQDTFVGMFFSQIATFFIIVTTGATLHANGSGEIATAAQAASALKPIAGDFAFLLFALGIVGTGLLAVPVLAGSASYAISETLDWKAGLSMKLKKAHGFYGVITIATLLGLIINFVGVSPIAALYYTAIINGVIAAPLIFVIVMISNNKKIMSGKTNGVWSNLLGIIAGVLMSAFAILLISSFFGR